jgi:hypothetical protein
MDSFPLPRDVAREPDIDRKQAHHLFLVVEHGRIAAKAL